MPGMNCCYLLLPILPPATEIDRKFEAQMMFANPRTDQVVIPTRDEMIGFYLGARRRIAEDKMRSSQKMIEKIEEIRERQNRRKSKQKENRAVLGIGTRTTRIKNQPGAIEDVDALLRIVNQLRKANAEN